MTKLLRVLSHFSLCVMSQCVAHLAGPNAHPHLHLISTWVSTVLESGATLDVHQLSVTTNAEVMPLLDCLLDHFQRRRDPLYL